MDVQALVDDNKLMLGSRVVKLEISDEDIIQLINKAFRMIKPYSTPTKTITKTLAPVIPLKADRVLDVVRVYPADLVISNGREVLFDFELFKRSRLLDTPTELVRGAMLPDYEVPFKFEDGVLYLDNTYYSRVVSIECLMDITVEEVEEERVISWIERYSLALCKEVVGRIRSKYKSSDIPVEFDGDTLLNESVQEKQECIQELSERSYGNFSILR